MGAQAVCIGRPYLSVEARGLRAVGCRARPRDPPYLDARRDAAGRRAVNQASHQGYGASYDRLAPSLRDRKFADSSVEEAVRSEPVSDGSNAVG